MENKQTIRVRSPKTPIEGWLRLYLVQDAGRCAKGASRKSHHLTSTENNMTARIEHHEGGGVSFVGTDAMNVFNAFALAGYCKLYATSGIRPTRTDRKSTRLNSSHVEISYAV